MSLRLACATCSSRGGGWQSAGTRTSLRRAERAGAPAPPAGDQRRGGRARGLRRGLAWREDHPRRGQGIGCGYAASARGGGSARCEAAERERAAAADRAKHDPFADRLPDHSVVHRYARCLSYPEWGVGSVTGIYFSGDGDEVKQWARVLFAEGVRTVPAGSLSFVDFSKPDAGADRLERFMTAATHALADGDYALAAQRLIYARDAVQTNVAVLRLMTLAFWQAGNLEAAGRAVRDWARIDGVRPAAHRFAARIYEDMGAIDLAAEAAERAADRAPGDAREWERLGRLRLRLHDPSAAADALRRAQTLASERRGLLDLALALALSGDLGGELSACEAATQLDPQSIDAWVRLAHALARTDRISDCLDACATALKLGAGAELLDLRDRMREARRRVLRQRSRPRGRCFGARPRNADLARCRSLDKATECLHPLGCANPRRALGGLPAAPERGDPQVQDLVRWGRLLECRRIGLEHACLCSQAVRVVVARAARERRGVDRPARSAGAE